MLDNLFKELIKINESAILAYKAEGSGFDKLDALDELFMLENMWSPSSELSSIIYTASMSSMIIKLSLVLVEELKETRETYESNVDDYVEIQNVEELNRSLKQIAGLSAFIIRFVFKNKMKTVKRVGYDSYIMLYLKEIITECNPVINSLDPYKHLVNKLLEKGYDLEELYMRSDNLDETVLKEILAGKQNLMEIDYNENYDTYIEEEE